MPKVYVKVWDPEEEEWIYILEDEVPLSDMTPQTGDPSATALWGLVCAGSLSGIALILKKKPRKEDERP